MVAWRASIVCVAITGGFSARIHHDLVLKLPEPPATIPGSDLVAAHQSSDIISCVRASLNRPLLVFTTPSFNDSEPRSSSMYDATSRSALRESPRRRGRSYAEMKASNETSPVESGLFLVALRPTMVLHV